MTLLVKVDRIILDGEVHSRRLVKGRATRLST